MAHTSLGLEVHKRFADALAGKAVIDKQPKLEGRSMMMFMSLSLIHISEPTRPY